MNEAFKKSTRARTFNITDSRNYLILFIIWPFLAFISALANFHNKGARCVIYLFLLYFGFTYFINSAYYVDAMGYAMDLMNNASLNFKEFISTSGRLYNSDNSVDILEPFLSFIISRITVDYRVLFGLYAAIFGYFYLKSINLLYKSYSANPGMNTGIHLAFFTIILPISAINGFRMWTAAWIFFYGAYHVILYRNPKFLIITSAAILVHWSFLSANAILFIYYFVGNRNYIYFPVALTSFFIPNLLSPYFRLISIKLGGPIQSRYEGYSSSEHMDVIQNIVEQADWYLVFTNKFVFYYLLLAIIMLRLSHRSAKKEKTAENNLYSFLLLFVAFVNFGRIIPSFGERFQAVFFLFAVAYVLQHLIKENSKRLTPITLIGLLPMGLFSIVTFRQGVENANAWILSPGFGIPWLVPGISIAELLF